MNNSKPFDMTETARQLLETAERLFAQKGISSVSIREINREAGNKNHTAIQYHFGTLDQLIQVILDYRMLPLNAERETYLAKLLQNKQNCDFNTEELARHLISAIVVPFSRQLLSSEQDSYYINLLNQIFNQDDGTEVFLKNPKRTSGLIFIYEELEKVLSYLPKAILTERLQSLGACTIQTVSRWEKEQRTKQRVLNESSLQILSNDLITFLTAGLTSPIHETRQ